MNISIKEDAVERLAKEIEEVDKKLQSVVKTFPTYEDGHDLKLMWLWQKAALERAFETMTGVMYIDYWIDKVNQEIEQEGA